MNLFSDRDGCSKTGTVITSLNVLERCKSQNKVDMFRTVKDLRDMRPNMVNNLVSSLKLMQ